MSGKRDVIFVYNEGTNKEFIQDIADKRNHSVSYVINFLIDHLRKNIPLQNKIKTHVPVSVKKSEKTLEKWNAKTKE